MRRPKRASLAACVSLLALLAVGATPAAAAESHPFQNEQSTAGVAGSFEDACGVARDSSNDTYIADYYHNSVYVLSSSGQLLAQIANVSNGNGPCALAVDSTGHIYVNNWRAELVRYTPSSYPPTETTTYGTPTVIDASGTVTGVAIGSSDNVFVDDGTHVSRYDSLGNPLSEFSLGPLTAGYGIAVSTFPATAGDVYIPDATSRTVKVFDSAGNPLAPIDGKGTPQAGFSYLVDASIAVDNNAASPSYGHVFVTDNVGHDQSEHPEAAVDEFNATGQYRSQISRWTTSPPGEPGVLIDHHLIDAEPSGLTIGSNGNVYVTSENSDASQSGTVDRNGKPLQGSVLYTFGPTITARTLEVSRVGSGVGSVKSEPAGINCNSACTAEYDNEAQVTLTATPDSHSEFSGWSGCPNPEGSNCKVTMSTGIAVSAEFAAIPQHTLTVTKVGAGEGIVTSTPTGLSCPGACSEHFNENSTVLLTAAPAPHNKLASWTGECLPAEYPNAPNECAVQMDAAKSIEADFEAIPQQTLTVNASGEGAVTSLPVGIECGAICTEQFDEGSTVILAATPVIHHQITWAGCSTQLSPTECEVTMSAAESVSASFTPILHNLTISVVGSGSVSAGNGAISGCTASIGTCSGLYPEGEVATLTASPAVGSTFAGWSGEGCAGSAPCHLTISAAAAVTAYFAELPAPPIAAQLVIGKVAVKRATATVEVTTSGPGQLEVNGGRPLTLETLAVPGAGKMTVHLALSEKGRQALARSRRHPLAIPVVLTLTPAEGGAPAVVTKVVVFTLGSRRHSRHK